MAYPGGVPDAPPRMIGRRRWPGPKSFHVVNHFEGKIRNEKTFVKFFFYFFLLSVKLFTGWSRMDGPGWMVQDVPGWMAHRTGSTRTGWAVQDPPQRRTLSRMGRRATGQDGRYLVWLHSAGPGTGKIWPPDQWSRISGPGSAVQDVPPCVVSRCPGMICGFHICAVTAYRVAGGVVVYYLLFWLSVALFFGM